MNIDIDIDGQAVDALRTLDRTPASMAEAYILGYRRGWDDALALAIRVEQAINTGDTGIFSDQVPA